MDRLILGVALLISEITCAQTLEDSLQRNIKNGQPVEQIAESLLELGEIYSSKDLKQSNHYYHCVIKLAKTYPVKSIQLGIANAKLSVNFTRMAKHDSAMHYMNLATQIYEANQNEPDLAVVYLLCLSSKLKLENKLVESIQPALQALAYQGNSHQRKWAAHALLTLGSSFSMIGDYSNALAYDKQSLELFKQEKDELGISYALFQIAVQLHLERELITAEKYYLQAIAIQKKLQSVKGLANSYGFLASLYRQAGKLQQSLLKIDSALVLSDGLGQTGMHISNLESKASTLLELGRMTEAKAMLDSALALASQLNNASQTAFLKASLAHWYLKSGNTSFALSTANDAALAAQATKSLDTKVRAYEVAADVNKQANRFETALAYSQQIIRLKDSAKSVRTVERLRMFDIQQELAQKQNEVALLSASQKIQQAAIKQQQLIQWGIALLLMIVLVGAWLILNRQRALSTISRNLEIEKVRNRIARDLHDDLGSSLSSIKILSQVGLEGNGHAQASLEKIKTKSGALLESISDMVWSINNNNDSTEQLLSRMREYASEMLEGNGIQFQFNAKNSKSIPLTLDQRKNIYLIFKEIIHNIIKHSQAKWVKINIKFDPALKMIVQDDGIGTIPENIRGNGLFNMQSRAREINGTLHISSLPTVGTTIELQATIT